MLRNDKNQVSSGFAGIKIVFPNPGYMSGFSLDSNAVPRMKAHLISRPITVFDVERSPILTIIMHDNETPWKPQMTTSYKTLFIMSQMIYSHINAKENQFYIQNKALCNNVSKMLIGQTHINEDKLFKEISKLSPHDVNSFKNLIVENTFKYINLLEKCLYMLFIKNSKVNVGLNQCYTQRDMYGELDIKHKGYVKFFQEKDLILRKENGVHDGEFFNFKIDINTQYMRLMRKIKK